MLTTEQRQAILDYINGDDPTEEVDDLLYEKFWTDMPYGTAKARTGDPDQWYSDHLDWIADWIGATLDKQSFEWRLV